MSISLEFGSLRPYLMSLAAIAIVMSVAGYVAGCMDFGAVRSDVVMYAVYYLCLPVVSMILGLAIGVWAKHHSVRRYRPEWTHVERDMNIEEVVETLRKIDRALFGVIATARLPHFLVPSITVVFFSTIPLLATDFPTLMLPWPFLGTAAILIVVLVSFYGSYRATSNVASDDVSPRYFREALWLAREQGRVLGVSGVRIRVKESRSGDILTLRWPRVVAHVSCIEKNSLIVSRSTELGSISRVVCTLSDEDGRTLASWRWDARLPFFVRLPEGSTKARVERYLISGPQGFLGVKDVRQLTMEAVALVALEWFRLFGPREDVARLLNDIGVETAPRVGVS